MIKKKKKHIKISTIHNQNHNQSKIHFPVVEPYVQYVPTVAYFTTLRFALSPPPCPKALILMCD